MAIGYSSLGAGSTTKQLTACGKDTPESIKHSNFLLNRLDSLLSALSDIKQRLRESVFSITYPREQPSSPTPTSNKEGGKEDIFVNKLESRLDGLECLIDDLKGIAYALEGF